ncbi:MAG: methyltransferase [Bacteroidota bacterium]
MTEQQVKPFQFKQFTIEQDQCPMKVGTDGVLLGAWAEVAGAKKALDVGTGTGLIAIMLGQRTEELHIAAVEIDEKACEQAKANMAKVPWSDRLEVLNQPIQEYARSSSETYDLVVSNPPFFTGGTFSVKEDRNSVRHTVKLPHGDLLIAVRKLLAPAGKFAVILPYIEGLRFIELATTYNLHLTKKMEVRPKVDKGVERLLLQFERSPKAVVEESLVIQKAARNDWTADYIRLTGDFYLKM